MILLPHQQRVVRERNDLHEKVSALIKFLEGDLYKTLELDERIRLTEQSIFMNAYLKILDERIAAFNNQKTK